MRLVRSFFHGKPDLEVIESESFFSLCCFSKNLQVFKNLLINVMSDGTHPQLRIKHEKKIELENMANGHCQFVSWTRDYLGSPELKLY